MGEGKKRTEQRKQLKVTKRVYINIFLNLALFQFCFKDSSAHLRCSGVVFIESVIFSALFLELRVIFV